MLSPAHQQTLIQLRLRLRNGEAVPNEEIRDAIKMMREDRFAAASAGPAARKKRTLTDEEIAKL
jgi:hypothetical protein